MKFKIFAIFWLFFAFLRADPEKISRDIKSNEEKIAQNAREKREITDVLAQLGQKINDGRKNLKNLSVEAQELDFAIQKNVKISAEHEKRAQILKKNVKNLLSDREKIRQKVVQVLINEAAFSFVLRAENLPSPDDIILGEIYKNISARARQKILTLSNHEKTMSAQINFIHENLKIVQNELSAQKNRKIRYEKLRVDQEKLLAEIKKDLKIYNKKLADNEKERENLNQILANLNILRQNDKKPPLDPKNRAIYIKQLASSYKRVQTTKYRGKKTIPPFENYEVSQNFGNYFDPIYNLRVFNEAVILHSARENEPIRSIFDGKVAYAKEVPLLKKVVIIENHDGIHTIYAQLDKIAPTIKVGQKIKKGYVIGRIKNKLNFEITQKDRHINPMEVIR